MENPRVDDLAAEIAAFCRERVEKRAGKANRSDIPRKVLRGVLASLLAVPMALSGRPALRKAR